jgi:uncharacterized NAD(P)/FAD-binding protein YdhS
LLLQEFETKQQSIISAKNLEDNGKRLAWDWLEQQIIAKSYVLATENNISGADQKTSKFKESIYRYIQQMSPPNSDTNKYGGRSMKSIYVFTNT